MTPAQYFPKQFLQDQSNFKGGVMCGATLMELEKGNEHWPYLEHFLICEYELNLLNQTIYAHFHVDHATWLSNTVSFVDCRCASHYGGITHPIDILSFAEKHLSQYKLNERIAAALMLEYDQLFLNYVKDLCNTINFESLTPENLVAAIQQDSDNKRVKVQAYLSRKKREFLPSVIRYSRILLGDN